MEQETISKELKTEQRLYLERLNNTQIVDLNLIEYLRASIESHKDKSSLCVGWDYLKNNLTKDLKNILQNVEYIRFTYNSDNVRFILNYLNTMQVIKIDEELKKQLGSFVYVWKDIKRDCNKQEQEQNLKVFLTEQGFKEIEFLKMEIEETTEQFYQRLKEYYKEFENLKVECVLNINAIGLLGSFDKKITKKGKFVWSDYNNALMLIPKRCKTRGHIIKGKAYYKTIK